MDGAVGFRCVMGAINDVVRVALLIACGESEPTGSTQPQSLSQSEVSTTNR